MKYNKKSKSKIEASLNDFLWSKKIVKTVGHVGRASYKLPTPHLRYSFIDTFLLGTRNNLMFLNTSLTIKETAKGLFLAAKILRNGGKLLIVDTRASMSFLNSTIYKGGIIPSAISFSGRRWVGGTVSNWKIISRAVSYYIKNLSRFNILASSPERVVSRLRKMIDAYPGFLDYKEEKMMPRLYNFKIKKKWGRKKIRFTRHPDLIFVVNPHDSRHIIDEARGLKIPVIALVDSDTNLDGITIPIPVNNETMYWVYHCINSLIRLADFVQKTDLPYLQPYPMKEERPFFSLSSSVEQKRNNKKKAKGRRPDFFKKPISSIIKVSTFFQK